MRSRPLHALSLLAAVGATIVVAAACDVYDESLLGGGGAGAGSSSSSGGAGGEDPPLDCDAPSDCPGDDTECGTRTCVGGKCGMDAAPAGTLANEQTSGDCLRQECDGAGFIVGVADDADAPDDDNDCTNDVCEGGLPSHPPRAVGSLCTGGANAKVCNADAVCVECVDGSDCTSNVCTQSFNCAPASCGDTVKNGSETDVDCGGSACPKCEIGDDCSVGSDCLSNACSGTCQPSCTDGIENQNESDVDCGGVCSDCAFGQSCNVGGDCDTGTCSAVNTCSCAPVNGVLIVSEVQSRGPGGAADEFVELFNPGTVAVTFSDTWTIRSRSDAAGSYTVRYTGAGQVVPPGGHLLIVGTAYSGAVAGDATLASGITDEASVTVENGANVVDAVCFHCGANPFSTHVCEGMPAVKVGCSNNVAKAIERKPGGPMGNCIDTGNNNADFAEINPSNPQNLASPATP